MPGARLSAVVFTRFWIDFREGVITVGTGAPGSSGCYSWADPEPIPSVHYVGLSAWDRHVAYKNIQVALGTTACLHGLRL